MKAVIPTGVISLCKIFIFTMLAMVSMNALAGDMYIGNPNRPYTVWVPGHCVNGCWQQGYYMKFIDTPIDSSNVSWVDGQYDANGNWIPAHWQVHSYRVVSGY